MPTLTTNFEAFQEALIQASGLMHAKSGLGRTERRQVFSTEKEVLSL